jgi:hypothetical protein
MSWDLEPRGGAVIVHMRSNAVNRMNPSLFDDALGAFDVMQVVLVVSALLADAVALWAIGDRIGELGFSPNRTAALGANVILLANLAWSAWLSLRFVTRRGSVTSLERWQTNYLYVFAVWASIVVVVFPPAFGYV